MSILKNEIPILEFDTDRTAVISPTHEKIDLKLPRKCVFAFLGEYISTYAPPSRFMEIDERARRAIEETVTEHGMNYQEVITWSTDGFFRETREKVASLPSSSRSICRICFAYSLSPS